MAGSRIGSREQVLAAARALEEVARRAWVWVSMPVIEGVTPRVLRDTTRSEAVTTDEFLPRRQGTFRLDEIGLACLDHVALYGDGCFEGILAPNQAIFLYREHLWRMWRSAEKLNIAIPYDFEELAWQVLETTRRVSYEPGEAGYIRLVLTRGMGDLGINPAKCVGATVFSLSSTIRLYPPDMYERGIELGLARHIRRPDARVLDPTVKGTQYINNVLALMEGTRGGELLECLVLTREGFIAEATVDNIFVVIRQPGWEKDPSRITIRTPRAAYCLNGITRALVLYLARRHGYRVDDEADLVPTDLLGSDRECFMTGTGAGMMPIIAMDGHSVADGVPGPITRLLRSEVVAAMQDTAYGLPFDATRQDLRDYLDAPSPIGLTPQGQAVVRTPPGRISA